MAIACDLTIKFGTAGNSLAFLGGGWARSEPEFTWAVGAESHLVLPRPVAADEYILTLDVVPFVHPPGLPTQRLIVSVNDEVVGSSTLTRPTLLGYRIPRSVVGSSERVLITLQHPDAARPKDFADTGDDRDLSFSLLEAKLYRVTETPDLQNSRLPPGLMVGPTRERSFGSRSHVDVAEWAINRTGMTISQIALQFESLGENCEFGLFQRQCDSEPLGLLRFSSTFMRNLIRGIENGFQGLGAAEDIDPRLEGGPRKEYMIHEKKFGLVYHTFVYEGQRSIWLMREQESARLKFLLRKFVEELQLGEKIFVYKRNAPVTEEEILPLHMALNTYGDNTLLWVVPRGTGPPRRDGRSRHAGLAEGLYRSLRSGEQRTRLLFRRLVAGVCERLRPVAAAEARTRGAGGLIPRAAPAVLLYDWDNTLVDGWAGITAAMNAVFEAFERPIWSVEDTRNKVRVVVAGEFPGDVRRPLGVRARSVLSDVDRESFGPCQSDAGRGSCSSGWGGVAPGGCVEQGWGIFAT